MYSFIQGDVTEPLANYYATPPEGKAVLIPHVVNNVGAYNAGVARAIAEKWPHAASKHKRRCNIWASSPEGLLGQVQLVMVQNNEGIRLIVANMFAQAGLRSKFNSMPLRYSALEQSMAATESMATEMYGNRIEFHCPRFGCGLAGGDWTTIELMIKETWASRHRVLVYSFGV